MAAITDQKAVFTDPNTEEPGWPREGEVNDENQNQKVSNVRARILPVCICSSTIGGAAGCVVWLAGASGSAVAATIGIATLIVLSSVFGKYLCKC